MDLQIETLWRRVEAVSQDIATDKLTLGRLFLQLRELYSDRNSGGRRLTSGHGCFEKEIVRRGYKPRRVRELIVDYQASLTGEPSTSAKRRARRGRKSTGTDPVGEFAKLLSLRALRAAYRVEAQQIHPDHGGDIEKMRALNLAWQEVEKQYEGGGNEMNTTIRWRTAEYCN